MTQFNDEVFRDLVRAILHMGTADVHFTKKDGSDRFMKCTLNSNNIPDEFIPKGTVHKVSGESLAVFDVEVQGWRSFRWDSLKSAKLMVE
jgi:hypothetical protein